MTFSFGNLLLAAGRNTPPLARSGFLNGFCGSLFCFRHQFLRFLNGFGFLRIHESSDLSSLTCVWHTLTMSEIGYPECSVLHKTKKSRRRADRFSKATTIAVCSHGSGAPLSALTSSLFEPHRFTLPKRSFDGLYRKAHPLIVSRTVNRRGFARMAALVRRCLGPAEGITENRISEGTVVEARYRRSDTENPSMPAAANCWLSLAGVLQSATGAVQRLPLPERSPL